MVNPELGVQIESVLKKLNLKYSRAIDNEEIIYNLKFKNSITEKESIKYDVKIIPNNMLGAIRFYCFDFNIKKITDESYIEIVEYLEKLNRGLLYGYLVLEKESNQITISFRYGISLNRGGQELSKEEVRELLHYIGTIIEKIYLDLKEY